MPNDTTMIGTKRSASELSNSSDNSQNDENEGKSTVDNTVENKNIPTLTNDAQEAEGTYKCLPIHGDHKRAVSCLAFAPTIRTARNMGSGTRNDDIICASASADGSVRLWDISKYVDENDLEIANEDAEMAEVEEGVAAATNTASHGTTSKRLNPVAIITGHTRGINDLAWSPRTPSLIATASDDKTLRIWDANRSAVSPDSANSNSVGSPSVGTGQNMGSTSGNGACEEANNITDALVEFKGHTNFCFSTKFSPQGNLLVSGSFDETVKIWDVRTGECVSTLPAHSDPVTGVDFNTDGTCIVSSSHDGLMRIWDVATGECLKTIYAEGNPPVTFVRYSPNGKYVLSGMLDGRLRLWNVMGGADNSSSSGQGSGHALLDDPSKPKEPVLKNYLSIGLTCSQGRGGQCTKTYSGHKNSKYCIFSAFSVAKPERQSIVTGSEDGKIHVYDLQTRKARQVLNGHNDACLAVAVHDRKEIFASGGMSKDRLVKFWVPTKTF